MCFLCFSGLCASTLEGRNWGLKGLKLGPYTPQSLASEGSGARVFLFQILADPSILRQQICTSCLCVGACEFGMFVNVLCSNVQCTLYSRVCCTTYVHCTCIVSNAVLLGTHYNNTVNFVNKRVQWTIIENKCVLLSRIITITSFFHLFSPFLLLIS